MRLTKSPQEMTFGDLTRREKQVGRLMAQGFRSKEIARKLGLSHYTVTNHRRHIADKVLIDKGPRRPVKLGIALWVIKNDPRSNMKQSADSMAHQPS